MSLLGEGPAVTPALLREIGLFGGLDEETLGVLSRELPIVDVDVGQVVVREGDAASEMYVILSGELEVVRAGRTGQHVRVAVFGPGGWFGEMALLDVQPRSATVRTLARTSLLRISREHVDRLFYRRDVRAYALFVMNIARELSRRLRVADGILTSVYAAMDEQARGHGDRPIHSA